MIDTKQKILEAALELFSRRGFEAVSVRDIAGEVGIRESSLYNHFRNKQEIFDTLVELCWKKAENYFRAHSLPFSTEDDCSVFAARDLDRLAEPVSQVFRYFFEDPWNIRFRRLLLLSRFTNDRAEKLYKKLFLEYPLDFQKKLFAGLVEAGEFREGDPETLALEFYGPVYLLLDSCESWDQAAPRFFAHLESFTESLRLSAQSKGEKQ